MYPICLSFHRYKDKTPSEDKTPCPYDKSGQYFILECFYVKKSSDGSIPYNLIGLIPLQYQNTYIHFFNTKFLHHIRYNHILSMSYFQLRRYTLKSPKVCATMKYKCLAVTHNLHQWK